MTTLLWIIVAIWIVATACVSWDIRTRLARIEARLMAVALLGRKDSVKAKTTTRIDRRARLWARKNL